MWFAARGEGILYTGEKSEENSKYKSPAKILLNGLGADEQLAGKFYVVRFKKNRICKTQRSI